MKTILRVMSKKNICFLANDAKHQNPCVQRCAQDSMVTHLLKQK